MATAVARACEAGVGCHVVDAEMSLRMALPSTITFEELPLKAIESTATTHFTFVVSKAEGVVNLDVHTQLPDLLVKIQEGKLHEAGPCLGLWSDIKLDDFQIAVIPAVDADPPSFTVIKMVSFRGRVHRSKIASTIHADLYIADMTLVPSINRFHTAMQSLFVELGGHQITTKQVAVKPGSTRGRKVKTNEEQDNGFAFIREFGPRANNRNQFVEWTERHISAEDSPIYGWDRQMVEKSLRNYAAGSSVAPDMSTYPLTLADFKPWVLRDLVFPCLRECTQKGIIMHGLSGIGKTPLATAVGLAVSGYHLAEADRADVPPAVRSAQHIDNFRAEAASCFKPAIFDDANLSAVSSADIKGFFDTSTAVMLWARWGACVFAANQLRIICNNPINRDADRPDLDFFTTEVSHDVFCNLTRPAYNIGMNDEDFLAVLKRCVYIVFAPHRAYIWLPGAVLVRSGGRRLSYLMRLDDLKILT